MTMKNDKSKISKPVKTEKKVAPPKAPEPVAVVAKKAKAVKASAPVAPSPAVTPAPVAKTTPAAKSAPAVKAPARKITTEDITLRAHAIWEAQGRPSGRELENWLQAEKELLAA